MIHGKLEKTGEVNMELLDDKGSLIETKIYTKVEDKDGYKKLEYVNLPTLDQSFYVKFETTADIKNISIEVEFTYLDNCTAEAYYYVGTEWEYKWEDITTTDECCKETHKAGTHIINGEPCDGTDNPIIHYYHQYQLKKVDTQVDPQMLIGLEISYNEEGKMQVEANKNWKTISSKNRDNPPDTPPPTTTNITMELGGYVWIDKKGGKYNTTNSILDDFDTSYNIKKEKSEVLPGAEVWLYEYTGENDAGTLKRIMLTDANGHYSFTGLNAQKKYYVKFVYNGMMYDSVEYNKGNPEYNTSGWYKTSKANEVGRTEFNNQFAEIRSYPENYEIKNPMFDRLGTYNIAFPQEEIVEIFKKISTEVSKNGGNLKKACETVAGENADITLKRKIQFAADCRISAETDHKNKKQFNGTDNTYVYPVYNLFTTSTEKAIINGITYKPIYEGQRYINLGIKARGTVDLALEKQDVPKVEVSINGKTETYTFDQWKTPSVGIDESFYLDELRKAYQSVEFDSVIKGKIEQITNARTRDIEQGKYYLYTRKEEITNGSSFEVGSGGEAYNLTGTEKLNIEITYKIPIVNQSSTIASVTEIVDYYDKNYTFKQAYVGDENGKKYEGDEGLVMTVRNEEDTDYISTYGTNTEYKDSNTYNTIYLIPTTEVRLGDNHKQYIYVVFYLNDANKAGELLAKVLTGDNSELKTMNLAEINGYKTYDPDNSGTSPGLVDMDSNPGNLNLTKIALNNELKLSTIDKIVEAGSNKKHPEYNNYKADYTTLKSMYEDDTNRAPTLITKKPNGSRTLEGTVFEDSTGKDERVYTGNPRTGNGQLDDGETKIAGVKVELVEIKEVNENGNTKKKLITRATTKTDNDGSYKFTGFLPGDYTIRYTYGQDNATAMPSSDIKVNDATINYQGKNLKSYNGQDYQSTTILYNENGSAEYTEDSSNGKKEKIYTREDGGYWYTADNKQSDAKDDEVRKTEVINYSKNKYETEIVNHKAEVFNAYKNEQPDYINKDYHQSLVDELKGNTYRYAYTPEMEVEIEYAKETIKASENEIEHKITNIDFGIVERPKSELVLDQKIEKIKVTAADGTVLFDVYDATTGVSNLQWIKGNNTNKGYNGKTITGDNNRTAYEIGEKVSIIMDEELISGSKLEITYKLIVTNNGEKDGNSTTSATTVLNYVSNNLNFDESINNGWEVVNIQDIQNGNTSTYVNSKSGIDLTTQAVILKTNALSKPLEPGEQTSCTLTLSKVLSAESSSDDLKYTNLAEIVEINNTVGRYDHGAIPGNQNVDEEPQEHDTAGGSNDGEVVVIPPTGSQYIYYVIGITSAIILGLGIFLIKKFVIKK